ncbi:MAG TPA: PAS domain S-box protein [Candidatus Binatia bacterium]|nr:PAS domain S-box protein [Candidatus Binatia bacterium]
MVELLSQIESLANRLSATEWEAVARHGLITELKHSQQLVRFELDRVFAELHRHATDEELLAIHKTYRAYIDAIDEEFRLLEHTRIAEAIRMDDEKVDSTFDALIDLLGHAQIRYAAASRWTIFAADIGSSLALILAALFTGILFSRYEQVQRGEQVLLAAQNALRQSEARFRSLVQNASEVMAVLNPLPPTVLFISDSVRRILGHNPDRLTGSDFGKLVHPDDGGKMQRFLANCAYSSALTHTIEVRLRRGDGQWTTVEIFGDNRLADPAVGGLVVNFRDVSEARQIEAALTQKGYEFDPTDRKLH